MTDYNKLTVAKLKVELKQRGLTQTGLKPVLVARLTEADAQAKRDDPAPDKEDAEPDDGDQHNHTLTKLGNDQSEQQELKAQDNAPEKQPKSKTAEDINLKDHDDKQEIALEQEEHTKGKAVDLERESSTHETPLQQTARDALPTEVSQSIVSIEPIASADGEVAAPEVVPDDDTALAVQSISVETESVSLVSTQTSINPEEIIEDRKKRKRRSQSPPPTWVETAKKRARAEDGSPRVRLPEDVTPDKQLIGELIGSENVVMSDAPPVEATQSTEPGDEKSQEIEVETTVAHEPIVKPVDTDMRSPPQQTEEKQMTSETIQQEASSEKPLSESPTKASPSDTRFKNLFPAAPKRGASPPRPSDYPDDSETRVIKPALHPATPALYIRNFMRPLHQGTLKAHLLTLATPTPTPTTDSTPTSDLISDFFLDSIRTHCLVRFYSTSAASRVRSALHDRVWPDERTRKPLWVDFIPEEKIKKWIEVELDASSSRGQPAKRWEVVYEEDREGSGIAAYLQEADPSGGGGGGGSSNAPRHSVSTTNRNEAGRGVQGAPLGPRITDERAPPSFPQQQQQHQHTAAAPAREKSDTGKGFKALDDLFKSTAAKPKLYFLPVTKAVADKRLDELAAGRGGGRGYEMRRYSFEEDVIVDRGPEFGSGARGGGYRGRGGGGGGGTGAGYGGRGGGGYRGSDSWRDRR
ncbi:hypothetical protein MMC24_001699 [Lignoscripta atroalba]|nr:hypothetical protein [Lignoscripta atroalba]